MRSMHQAYDAQADALYITLRELGDGEYVARTVEIDNDTNADHDADGKLIGIEVLSAHGRLWPLPEILRRWEITDEDQMSIFGLYPCVLLVSMTAPLVPCC